MSEDNPYYKEMFDCRNLDAMFKKHFLGTWSCAPGPLSGERLLTLANDVRKAEFCTIEETMSMAYELLEARRMAEKPCMKLKIYHTTYGCDSGCCGHAVETEDGDARKFGFQFDHAEGDSAEEKRAFGVKMVGEENLADVDWEASNIKDYMACY
jgi:hypothetical protein